MYRAANTAIKTAIAAAFIVAAGYLFTSGAMIAVSQQTVQECSND